MTRTELKALPITDQIMFRASGAIGYPAPSTKAEQDALKTLLNEGKVYCAGRSQNGLTNYYRVVSKAA